MFSKVSLTAIDNIYIFAADCIDLNTLKDQFSDEQVIITLPNRNRHIIISQSNISDLTQTQDDTDWAKENIKDKLALLTQNTSLLFTPQMIDLEKMGGVSFTKGCYVGQEIVARTQHLGKLKRHLHRVQIKTDQVLKPGDSLHNNNNEKVGIIVNAVFHDGVLDALAVVEDRLLDTIDHCIA